MTARYMFQRYRARFFSGLPLIGLDSLAAQTVLDVHCDVSFAGLSRRIQLPSEGTLEPVKEKISHTRKDPFGRISIGVSLGSVFSHSSDWANA